MHTQITHPPGRAAVTTQQILNALDDEGAAPAEVSVEPDRLANAGHDHCVHEGVYLVSLTFCFVEKDDVDVGPRRGLGPGGAAVVGVAAAVGVGLGHGRG